jgi:lysophospholipase L1-like esterase
METKFFPSLASLRKTSRRIVDDIDLTMFGSFAWTRPERVIMEGKPSKRRCLQVLITVGILLSVQRFRENFRHAGIICIGDNLTAGLIRTTAANGEALVTFHPYSDALATALRGRERVLSFGFSGWTATNLLERSEMLSSVAEVIQGEKAVREVQKPGFGLAIKLHKPRLAIILAGTNDILQASDPDGQTVADHIWKLHEMAHRAGVRTIALGIPGWNRILDSDERQCSERIRARILCNNALHEYAVRNQAMSRYLAFPFAFDGNGSLWDVDGIHLTLEGYRRVGVHLAENLEFSPVAKTRDSSAVEFIVA